MKRYIVKPQAKGMITIPSRIRERLGITPHTPVQITLENEKIVLTVLHDTRSLLTGTPKVFPGDSVLSIAQTGQTICQLPSSESTGLSLMIGSSGVSRTLLIHNLVLQALAEGRGVLFLDPFGGICSEFRESLQSIQNAPRIHSVEAGIFADNTSRFVRDVPWDLLLHDHQFLAADLGIGIIGQHAAASIGQQMLNEFFSRYRSAGRGKFTLYLNAPEHFITLPMLREYETARDRDLAIILGIEHVMSLGKDIRERLAFAARNVYCFRTDSESADFVVRNFKLSLPPGNLNSLAWDQCHARIQYSDGTVYEGPLNPLACKVETFSRTTLENE